MTTGYVYILTNPSFREDWVKIGRSSRPVDVRSKELDNTAVPLPFEIYATLQTSKFGQIEKMLHGLLDQVANKRIRKNREFFNVEPAVALNVFNQLALLIDDAVVTVYKDNKPVSVIHPPVITPPPPTKKRLPRFRFEDVEIPVGSAVVFLPTNTPVRVAPGNKVEYKGKFYSLTGFVSAFIPASLKRSSGIYQGPSFFTFEGENRDDRKKRYLEGKTGPAPKPGNVGTGETTEIGITGDTGDTGDTGNPGDAPDKPVKPKRQCREPFRFSMVGIKSGETVIFDPTNLRVVVTDDRHVTHEGKRYTLSGFTALFMPATKQNTSGAYQGPKFFSYEGETLSDRRARFETEASDKPVSPDDE